MKLLLKFAWLYSKHEGFDRSWIDVISRELAMFEAGMKLEKIHRQRVDAVKSKESWTAPDDWIKEMLEENPDLTDKELWYAIPPSHESDAIHRDGERLYYSESGKSIGFSAFRERVKQQRKK